MNEIIPISSHWEFAHGITMGVLLNIAFFMLLFSVHSSLEKKPNTAIIFFYGACTMLACTLFYLYVINSYDDTLFSVLPDWLFNISKIGIAVGVFFNYRTFVKSLPITSLDGYLSWLKAKKYFLLVDIVLFFSIVSMIFFVDKPSDIIVISLFLMIFENAISIDIIKTTRETDVLKRLYIMVFYAIISIALVLIPTIIMYGLNGLSELSFIVFNVLFAAALIIYNFILIQHNLQESSLTEYTSKLNSDGFFKNIYHALNNDEFFIKYQPKIKLSTKEVCGLEALIRWNHKTKGLIPPDEFIPVAEKTNIINDICEWVIQQVMLDIAKLHSHNIVVPVSINFSVANITTDMVKVLADTLQKNDLPSSCIIIEITESLLLDMNENQNKAIQALTALGIKLSLDDFGAGHSSVRHLDKLSLSEIKIDRALINKMTNNNQKAVIQTLLNMCHILDIEVVAEGISDDTMLELATMKCEMGQGFGICYPKTIDDLIHWIQNN